MARDEKPMGPIGPIGPIGPASAAGDLPDAHSVWQDARDAADAEEPEDIEDIEDAEELRALAPLGAAVTAAELGRWQDHGHADAHVTPGEARQLLDALPEDTRRLLARAVALYLVLEDVPPVSVPPERLAVALPLLRAGLLLPVTAADQHRYDAQVWGTVSVGLVGLRPTERLLGAVLALLTNAAEDAWAWVATTTADYARLRVFLG